MRISQLSVFVPIALGLAFIVHQRAGADSESPSARALRSASFEGKWSGTTKCLYDPGLWPDDLCGTDWVVEISTGGAVKVLTWHGFVVEISRGGAVKVQQITRSKDGKETKSDISGKNFQFRKVETSAVITALDSGNDEDGHWVETWDFAMTLKDPDHMIVHWTRIVNNLDLPLEQKGSKFSVVEMGELTRVSNR